MLIIKIKIIFKTCCNNSSCTKLKGGKNGIATIWTRNISYEHLDSIFVIDNTNGLLLVR